MNYDQFTGIVRAIVPAIVGYFAAKNIISGETAGLIITAVTAVAAAVWSVLNNKTGKVVGA
jgi:hypothetical protein